MYYILELLYSDAGNFKSCFTHIVDEAEYPAVRKLRQGDLFEMGQYGTMDKESWFADDMDYDEDFDNNIWEVLSVKPQKTQFIFNKNGVCTNPEIVYHFGLPSDLAWRYLEIAVCVDEFGNWDFGHDAPGYCGPVCNRGKYKSKEEAIQAGIDLLKDRLQEESNVFGNHSKHKEHFLAWVATRNQLSLF